jgi:hypothetical protein
MLADDSAACGDAYPRNAAEALRLADACLDYLNCPGAGDLDGSACGEVLTALGELQAKLAAAHASFLRRFDAAGAHDADGYGSSSAWLAAKGRMSNLEALGKRRGGEDDRSEEQRFHDALQEAWVLPLGLG